jgi:uncharacterized protein involved in exopolysaccharide biosynthesis
VARAAATDGRPVTKGDAIIILVDNRRMSTSPSGQVTPASDVTPPVTPPAPAGMSKTYVGVLAFLGGLAVGAGAMHLSMKRNQLPSGQ